ncbi:MAG: hypothetical protein V4560_08740 [Bacteroidota bacterium]
MRTLILFFIFSFSAISLKAQDSYNYTPYGFGVFGGINRPYDDLRKANYGKTINVVGYYNISPYIPLGLEIQLGGISGGDTGTDPYRRQSNNHYTALIFHGDIGLGEIIDYSQSGFLGFVKDFYAGTGVGVINNNMVFVQRTNLNPTGYPVGTYRFPGEDKSLNVIFPLRFGYEYKLYNAWGEPQIGINVGYIHNITLGEGLDGYNDPPSHFKNNSPDQFSQIFIGIKYNFGYPRAYTKRINY